MPAGLMHIQFEFHYASTPFEEQSLKCLLSFEQHLGHLAGSGSKRPSAAHHPKYPARLLKHRPRTVLLFHVRN